MIFPKHLLLCLLWGLPSLAGAQPDSTVQDSVRPRKWGILPVPAIASSPETGWYIGAVALITYNPRLGDGTRTSNGKLEFNYTQNKQWIFDNNWNIFTRENKYNLQGELQWMLFPENFWGIGGNTTADQEERFETKRLEFSQQVLFSLRPNLYLGPVYRLQYLYDLVPADSGQLAEGIITGSQGGLSSGVGYRVAWDSRQNPLNAKQGALIQWQQIGFSPILGSDFTFLQTMLEARTYLPLREGHTLAFQGIGWFTAGDPPFRMMHLLGGNQRMRGYYQGRFRDKQYIMAQVEYRAHIWWRLGAAAFAGIGNVAPTLAGFGDSPWKPTLGAGLRVLTDKEEDINLRIDFAWGRDTFEFYLSFGEAF